MSLDSITRTIDESVGGFFEPIATWLGDVIFYAVDINGAEVPSSWPGWPLPASSSAAGSD